MLVFEESCDFGLHEDISSCGGVVGCGGVVLLLLLGRVDSVVVGGVAFDGGVWCESGSGGAGSDTSSGRAGAGVAADVGHFEDGRVFVGGLDHFLRSAVFHAALVVSSVMDSHEIRVELGWD